MGRRALDIGELNERTIDIIKARLGVLGMSGRELGRRANIKPSRMRSLLAAAQPLTVNELEQICNAVGLLDWAVLREAGEEDADALPTIDPEALGLAAKDDERETDQG